MHRKILLLLIAILITNGCATRQLVDQMSGSSAQRLITHSIDKMISALPDAEFTKMKDKTLFIVSHFIIENKLTEYALERLKFELQDTFECTLIDNPIEADFELHVFFTSLGTDQDLIGLTFPFLYLPEIAGSINVNILALDMFHGISEMYYYIVDNEKAEISRGSYISAVTKSERLATPIVSIPIRNEIKKETVPNGTPDDTERRGDQSPPGQNN